MIHFNERPFTDLLSAEKAMKRLILLRIFIASVAAVLLLGCDLLPG